MGIILSRTGVLIEKLQKSFGDLIHTFEWLKFNSDTFAKFKTSFFDVSPLDLKNFPGLQYDIHTELEQEKAQHFVEYAAGLKTQLEMQVADLESEIKANERLLSQATISEKERHRLVTENLTKEKKLKQLLDQAIAKEEKELAEAEVQRRQEEIYARYDVELKELKSMYDSGLISYKTMVKKEQDYHIEMYKELLTVYKKGSYMHYDIQRNLASMLKKQMMDNVKEVDDAVKLMISRYFNAKVGDNDTNFMLGGTKFDLRTREEKESNYKRNVEALELLRTRLIESSAGDEGKIGKVNKYMNHALRWEEINYKRSIGEDPMLSWRERLEDFNNWFKEDETQQIIAMVSNVASQIGGIFSNINQLIEIDLEVRLAKLTKYYDREISLAEGNSYKVKQLERRKSKELAKARKEASEKELNFQVFQALAQTAQNALAAYGSGLQAPWPTSLWLAPMMAGLATAAGMVQLAVIYKQQQAVKSVGYERGGFTPMGKEDEPVGIVHAGEWVASQKLVKSPTVRPILNCLEKAQRNNTLPSLYPSIVEKYIVKSEENLSLRNVIADLSAELKNLKMSQYSQVAVIKRLNARLEEPFVTVNTVTGDTGIKQAQEEYLRLMNNTLPKSKRKKLL